MKNSYKKKCRSLNYILANWCKIVKIRYKYWPRIRKVHYCQKLCNYISRKRQIFGTISSKLGILFFFGNVYKLHVRDIGNINLKYACDFLWWNFYVHMQIYGTSMHFHCYIYQAVSYFTKRKEVSHLSNIFTVLHSLWSIINNKRESIMIYTQPNLFSCFNSCRLTL